MNNILILSAGTRNKLVQYFMNEKPSSAKVVCTDMSEHAPAIYEADKYYITPHIRDRGYLDKIIKICVVEEIEAIFSLIDPELEVLVQNKEMFDELDVKILMSDKEVIEMCFDKFNFYETLTSHNFPSQRTYKSLNTFKSDLKDGVINFPVFVKPNTGSASLNISKVSNLDTLDNLFDNYDDLIIQEFIDGKEYGVDVYIDFIDQEVKSIFVKQKLKMRAGETDKSISVKNDELENIILNFVNHFKFRGQIDIDIFEADGKYFISEVNPRFGGGYPHAYEAGCNFPQMIYNNLRGKVNEAKIGNYDAGTVMMKYSDLIFKGANS